MNLSLLLFVFLLAGCGTKQSEQGDVLARAGSMELTEAEFELLAGEPLGSIPPEERWPIINRWIDDAVVLQEGHRQGLQDDAGLNSKIEAVRADLFLTRLLQDADDPDAREQEIYAYYDEHAAEFMCQNDSYMLRLYSARQCSVLTNFQARWIAGDTTLPANHSVTLDRHEMLDGGQASESLLKILAELQPGDWTEPQPASESCWTIMLEQLYPAGSQLPIEAVRPEIEMQLKIDASHHRREELMSDLRSRYPVTILLEDSL